MPRRPEFSGFAFPISNFQNPTVQVQLEEERQRDSVVLFPVRVDDAVKETKEEWAAKLRRSRNIGDFRRWKDHDAYQKAPRAGAARPPS